jgi:hypothetical protein
MPKRRLHPLNPGFRQYLGRLMPQWDSFDGQKKIELWNDYQASITDRQSDLVRVQRELSTKYGAKMEGMNQTDRMRLAEVAGTRNANGRTPQEELASIKASAPHDSINVQAWRENRIAILEKIIAAGV